MNFISLSNRQAVPFSILLTAVFFAGCSTVIPKQRAADGELSLEPTETSKADSVGKTSTAAPAKDLRAILNGLTARIEAMENKLTVYADKLDSTKMSVDALAAVQKPKPTPIVKHAAMSVGVDVAPQSVSSDPEAGLTQDEAVQSYRKALILVRALKFPDAAIAFTTFLDRYPDHPLAGSAQFHVGNAYFQQKEYKLAAQEFQKVLTSYDRSSHIAQTLRELAESEDFMKKSEDAARHRQLLMSLFPHSPYAIQTTASRKKEPEAKSPAPEAAAPAPAENRAEQPTSGTLTPARLDGPPPTVPMSNEISNEPLEDQKPKQ